MADFVIFFQLVVCCIIFVAFILNLIGSFKRKVKVDYNVSKEYEDMAYNMIINNKEMEEARKEHKKYSFINLIYILGFIACFILFIISPLFIIGTFIFIFLLIRNGIRQSSLNNHFEKIWQTIIGMLNNDLSFSKNEGISSSVYRSAGFSPEDRYHTEDLVYGSIKGVNVKIADVHTERESEDSDGNTTYTTVFLGTFVNCNLNKGIGCVVNIINNRLKIGNNDNYITIDNEKFEKEYDVFSNDSIKAMRLLTPDVTNRIMDLWTETGIKSEIVIIDKELYIRMYTTDMFRVSYSTPEKEAKQIGKYISILLSIIKIIEVIIDNVERIED